MIVCVCKNLSESRIREILANTNLSSLQELTGAGTQCQTCLETLIQIERDLNNEQSKTDQL